jgi:short subunit fatty acids transporter
MAMSPPVHAAVRRMAAVPQTGKGAVAYVAMFSMLSVRGGTDPIRKGSR